MWSTLTPFLLSAIYGEGGHVVGPAELLQGLGTQAQGHPGAGHLHSLYTAAEHSILALQQQGPACPWRLAAAADKQIERLSVVLQAVSRCSWFTSCLRLSDMPLSTPTAYLPPQSTRFSHAPTGHLSGSVREPRRTALSVVR